MNLTKDATDWVLRFVIALAQQFSSFTPFPVFPGASLPAQIASPGKIYKQAYRNHPLFPDALQLLVDMQSSSCSPHIYRRCELPIDIPSSVARSAASSLSSEGSVLLSPQDRDAQQSGMWIHLGDLATGEEAESSPEYVLESFPELSLANDVQQKNQAEPFGCQHTRTKLSDSESQRPDLTRKEFSSFKWVRALGEGGYAAAVAVRATELDRTPDYARTGGRLLCLKVFIKSAVMKRDLLHGVQRELLAYQTLASVCRRKKSAFIMELEASLEDKDRMYFAMDLMKYDLMAVLTEGRPGKRENRKRWIAQIASGLDALHGIGIIHRDIKPENLMIDCQDNIRIADFGASYVSSTRERVYPAGRYTDDVVGTWPYIPPEVWETRGKPRHYRKGYGTAVDYWALGCIVFELEASGSPLLFESEADLDIYRRWKPEKMHGKSFISSNRLSSHVESLILGLIHLDPLQRFGINDLRSHPYFRRTTGATEFDDIETHALTRPRCAPDESEDEIGRLDEPLVFNPMFNEPQGPVQPSTLNNLCWINPWGIWGSAPRR